MALFVVVLAAAGLTGCTSKPAPVAPPPRPVDIVVFLRDDATEPQKQAIEAKLRALPGVVAVTFETHEQAYARFKEQFKNSPDLVAATRPEALPESFRLRLADGVTAEPIVARLRLLPGVDEVTIPSKATPSPTR
jgi:cell division protein FtsX